MNDPAFVGSLCFLIGLCAGAFLMRAVSLEILNLVTKDATPEEAAKLPIAQLSKEEIERMLCYYNKLKEKSQ